MRSGWAAALAGFAACGRTPIVVDVGGLQGDGGAFDVARVDVVLAVDDSTSMQEEIAALQGPVLASFPAALMSLGDGLVDFQLAVIDGCATPPYFHDWGESGPCGLSTGRNHMVSTSPSFADEYACVMDLTTRGFGGAPDACTGANDDEQPLGAAAAALADRDGVNAGFLRDDAALLVVAITDEDERPIPRRSPLEIAEALVAAKGDVEHVFVLGIGGDHDCRGPYGEAYDARTLRAVVDLFIAAGRGWWWDLCEGRLDEAFAAAIAAMERG